MIRTGLFLVNGVLWGALAALIVLALLPGIVTAATPTVTLQSQSWWSRDGIVVPSRVGQHIHVTATVPADGAIVDGRISIPVTITLHAMPAATSWFRMGWENGVLFQTNVVLGPCADCSTSLTATIDLSGVPIGRHELRMSANIPDADPGLTGSQRQYQSTGFQICVRACSPSYRSSGPSIIARGWYQDHGYANPELTSALSTVRSGGTITVKLDKGSGGLTTKFAGVYIDPLFHEGSSGIVVREWTAAFRGSVTLPTLAPGPHRLVLLSSDGQDAGVISIPFDVQP